MPPKKKAVPPPGPLAECIVAFASLKFSKAGANDKSLDDYKNDITNSDGEFTNKIGQCSHLVVTDAQYQKKLARVKEAIALDNINIVTFDWLDQSLSSKKKVDESQFLLHAQNATNSPIKAGTKRARAASPDDDKTPSQAKKTKSAPSITNANGQDASKPEVASLNIPLDEELPDKHIYKVHIGDDDTIYDVTLNQTNSGNNNNKFYRIQLLIDHKNGHWCWTRWGRVGERGQTKMLGDGSFDLALKEFEKKFKDKNGNKWADRFAEVKSGKYSYIERSYEDSSDEDEAGPSKREKRMAAKGQVVVDDEDEKPIISKLSEPIQRLMRLIFNQEYFNTTLASLDYDATKMPLGKLSKNTLLRGYTVLKDLASLVGGGLGTEIADKSNQYFSLIPHAFGRNRPPVLNDMNLIKKEIALLESLTDMQLANEIMKDAKSKKGATEEKVNVLDRQYQGLGMQEMTALDPDSTEFTELRDYLSKSAGSTHRFGYKVQDIFRIERQGENDRFSQSKFASMPNSDRRLLWHGSRCTNYGGILSQGLRIAPPEAPVSGYMFGKGVYLADMSSKSANYCASFTSGGVGLLLLCEAELGKPPLKLTDANYDAGSDAAEQGSISTWGVGQQAPQGWKDASCVHENLQGVLMPDVKTKPPGPTKEANAYLQYNEYIVYDIAQVRLRYLLRVEIG